MIWKVSIFLVLFLVGGPVWASETRGPCGTGDTTSPYPDGSDSPSEAAAERKTAAIETLINSISSGQQALATLVEGLSTDINQQDLLTALDAAKRGATTEEQKYRLFEAMERIQNEADWKKLDDTQLSSLIREVETSASATNAEQTVAKLSALRAIRQERMQKVTEPQKLEKGKGSYNRDGKQQQEYILDKQRTVHFTGQRTADGQPIFSVEENGRLSRFTGGQLGLSLNSDGSISRTGSEQTNTRLLAQGGGGTITTSQGEVPRQTLDGKNFYWANPKTGTVETSSGPNTIVKQVAPDQLPTDARSKLLIQATGGGVPAITVAVASVSPDGIVAAGTPAAAAAPAPAPAAAGTPAAAAAPAAAPAAAAAPAPVPAAGAPAGAAAPAPAPTGAITIKSDYRLLPQYRSLGELVTAHNKRVAGTIDQQQFEGELVRIRGLVEENGNSGHIADEFRNLGVPEILAAEWALKLMSRAPRSTPQMQPNDHNVNKVESQIYDGDGPRHSNGYYFLQEDGQMAWVAYQRQESYYESDDRTYVSYDYRVPSPPILDRSQWGRVPTGPLTLANGDTWEPKLQRKYPRSPSL